MLQLLPEPASISHNHSGTSIISDITKKNKKPGFFDEISLLTVAVCGIMIFACPGCSAPIETYIVKLEALPGFPDPSEIDNPRQIVGTLVLGLTGRQPAIEEVGENRYQFTLAADLQPGVIARLQTPAVHLDLVGWDEYVADNRPIPHEAELIVTEQDMRTIYLEYDRLNKPLLIFEFTEDGQAKFEEYTANHVGNFIMFGVGGRVVNWIPIREPVLGNKGYIEGLLTREQAMRYLWGITMSMKGYRLVIVRDHETE